MFTDKSCKSQYNMLSMLYTFYSITDPTNGAYDTLFSNKKN